MIDALEGLLLSFKRARKRAMLDITQVDYRNFLPQIDCWIRAAARELRGDGSQSRLAEDDAEPGETDQRPLAALCSIISERQVLVPQAVKKRCQSLKDPLPEPLKNLYEPLIDHLAQSYPQLFIRSLVLTLMDILSAASDDQVKGKSAESTYYYTCAGWLVYLLLRPEGKVMGQETLRSLLIKPNQFTLSIVEKVQQAGESGWEDEEAVSPLMEVLKKAHESRRSESVPCEQIDARLETMKQRWESLVAKDESEEEPTIGGRGSAWKLVPEALWTPCPIGSLSDRSVPDLYKSLLQS